MLLNVLYISPASSQRFIQFISLVLLLHTNSFNQEIIWEQTNGPSNGNIWAIGIDEGDVIYAADDAKLFKSKDDGDSWELVKDWTSEADEIVEIVFNDSGHIFVGTFGGAGVYRSTDEGQTWLYPAFSLPGVNDIKIGHNSDIIAGTMLNVWISTDNGYNWVVKNQGLPGQTIVVCVFVDENENYFIGTYGSGIDRIYKSTNFGESWFASGNGITTLAVISLKETISNILFAGSADGQGIHRSTDGGLNWEYITIGLPLISADYILESNSLGFVFAGMSSGGVYRSTNNGEYWMKYNSGLTNETILSFALNKDGLLFAGTWGDGVFKTIRSTTNVEREVNEPIPDFFLMNYPTPFNSSTRIQYVVSSKQVVSLKVYDVLGREIATLVNEEKLPGLYEAEFDASGLASGIYIYQLKAGRFMQAKKMIILK